MKKTTKALLVIGGIFASIASVNYCIFKTANYLSETNGKNKYYKWKYGKIRYIVKGEGEPLVLVHNIYTGASVSEWEESLEFLSQKYKVYALDLLGFGDSEKLNISYSAYMYTTLINDFIKDIIGKKVDIIASGTSATFSVMSYYFEPSFYKHILLIAPTGVGSRNESPTSNSVWNRWLLESPIIGTAIYCINSAKFNINWALKEYYYENTRLVNKQAIRKLYYPAHKGGANSKFPIAALMTNHLNVSIEHVLPNVKIPLHIVWGDDNSLNPISNYLEIEKLNKHAKLTIFESSKVVPHKERAKEFSKVAIEFFEEDNVSKKQTL